MGSPISTEPLQFNLTLKVKTEKTGCRMVNGPGKATSLNS